MTTFPTTTDLQRLLDEQRPTSLLALLGDGELPPPLVLYRAAALIELDRDADAAAYLEPLLPTLTGDDRARAELLWAELLLLRGDVDTAILTAERAARAAVLPVLRAAALGWAARGLACKQCWKLAESALREAIELAPNDIEVLFAQARVALMMDQRLAARAIYERIAALSPARGAWGLALVAFLLGEFAAARGQIERAIAASDEVAGPLLMRGQIALATNDLPALEYTVAELAHRSPQAASLPAWQRALGDLQRSLAAPTDGTYARLTAFPTTMQRRDYCGPCTVELVLRYWRGGLDMTNDQIAQVVKFPGSGTPIYKMREFFHLVGFDTLRCRASIGQLKRLIDAGYPVIVEEEFPNSAHVVVAIGYDDAVSALIFQDPMTHIITRIPLDAVNRLRRPSLDAALIAFPAGQGHEKTLALMDLFDDQALVWADQANLALDEGRPHEAATLAAQAAARQPAFRLAWDLRLLAELRSWGQARHTRTWPEGSIADRLARQRADDPAAARERAYVALGQAAQAMPDAASIHQFTGRAAVLDGDLRRALESLQRARELEPDHARTLTLVAECYFALRDRDRALEAAARAVARDPALATANAWMARCLAQSDAERANHYARCAVEQAPDRWLAHLALAEVQIARGDINMARRAVGVALGLAPAEPDVRACFATILALQGEVVEAAGEIEALLGAERALSPASAYTMRQAFCRILFGAELYDQAALHAQELLALAPDDPWALQHHAAARAAACIATGLAGSAAAVEEVRQLYTYALAASQGAPPVARDYLESMVSLADLDTAIDAAAALRESYPQRGLGFIHGLLLARAGRAEEAAAAMLDALMQSEAIIDSDDLYQAIAAILEGRGSDAGTQAVLGLPETGAGVPRAMRDRVLGLLLARHEGTATLARELLEAAVGTQPDDASVTLYLGDLAATEELREARYRRALLLAPAWSYARYRLARYLLDRDRQDEALEFTSGHADESIELMELHGRALLQVGRYDEAAAAYARTSELIAAPPSGLCRYKWMAESNAGRHETAAATARQAAERFADEPSWHVQLATSLANLGQYEEALQVAAHGQAAGLDALDALEIAYTVAWARHDLPAALSVVEQALACGLDLPEGQLNAWEKRQLRLLLDLDREDQARALMVARSLSADGWGQAAWVTMEAERWPLLMEFADQALALESEHFAGLFARATALREQDREAEAMEAYHRLRRAHPNEHNAYEKLGLLLALEGQADSALELADRALGLGPFCHLAWATRGYVAFVRGDDDKALADFETSWSRANIDQRRGEHAFWWVWAALRGDTAAAATNRDQARVRAHTAVDWRHIDQIDALLLARA